MSLPDGWEEVSPSAKSSALPSGWEVVEPEGNDTTIVMENGIPVRKKTTFKEPKKKTIGDYALGLGEAALNLGSQVVATPIAAARGGLSQLLGGTGSDETREALEAFTYQPRTEAGQELAENDAYQHVLAGIPVGNIPTRAATLKAIQRNLPKPAIDPIGVPVEKPATPPVNAERGLDAAYRAAPEVDAQQVAALEAALRRRGTPEGTEVLTVDRSGRVGPSEALQAADDAARMEANERFRTQAHQMEIDATPEGYMANQFGGGQEMLRIDENGMPIRADRSMEAANLENPLQRNLWGDEMARQAEQEAPLSLTEAIDSMGAAERRAAINAELRGTLEASVDLQKAMRDIPDTGKSPFTLAGPNRPITAQTNVSASKGQWFTGSPEPLAATRSLTEQAGRSNAENQLLGPGHYITQSRDLAGTYGGPEGRAYSVEKPFEKPFMLQGKGNTAAYKELVETMGSKAEANRVLQARGYDAIVTTNGRGETIANIFNEKPVVDIGPARTYNAAPKQELSLLPYEAADKVSELKTGSPIGAVLENVPDVATRLAIVEEANPLKALNFSRGPNSVRGGIDFNSIERALKDMWNKVSPPEMPEASRPVALNKNNVQAMHNVPGLKEATRKWVVEDVPVETTKEAVLKEGRENGPIRLQNFRSGGIMTGTQRGSALIQNTAQALLNASTRAKNLVEDFVQPVERSIAKLVNSEVRQLASVLKDEMFSGIRYTDQQLAEIFNAKQYTAYKQMREMFETNLAKQNAALEAMGQKPVTPKEAYLASRWSGRFRIPVYDKEGKLIWYIAEHSKRKAESALNYLEKNGVSIDREKSKLETRSATDSFNQTNRGFLEQNYRTMLSLLEDGPAKEQVQALMENHMADVGSNTLGQKRHFEPKSNTRGFLGDRPWEDPTKEAYTLLRSQMDYAKNAFEWSEKQQAVAGIKQLLADPDIQALQPHNAEFVRQYTRNALGFGESKLFKAIEDTFSDKLGFDKGFAARGVGYAKQYFILQKLALNAGFYVSQLVQPLQSIPRHVELSALGYKHNPVRTLAGASVDFIAGFNNFVSDTAISQKLGHPKLRMSEFGRDAWKFMDENGVIDTSVLDDARNLGQNKGRDAVINMLGKGLSASEYLIRSNTFLQFAHHLEQSGKFAKTAEGRKALFQKAREFTDMSMVDFRPEERAMVFNKTGLVGQMASTLKSFLVNYYNNMGHYSQMALNGKPGPLVAALGIQTLAYGVLNFPGMQEVDQGWEWLKKNSPDSVYEHIKDVNIKQWAIEHMGEFATYGGLSKVTGANMANRGNIAVGDAFALDGLFPFIQDGLKQASAVAGAIVNPTSTNIEQAAYNLSMAGPMQGRFSQREAFEAGTTADGRTKYQKPTQLEKHEFDYARTPKQEAYKNWGFTELQEAKEKDLKRGVFGDDRQLAERRRGTIDKAFDALVRNNPDDFNTLVKRYNNFNGDPNDFINGLFNQALRMKVSPEAIIALRDNPSISDLQKLKEIQRVLGVIR